ncbi:MAG: hypothetical protein ACOH2E_04030 [Candidatus Paracaedibacter sp.]
MKPRVFSSSKVSVTHKFCQNSCATNHNQLTEGLLIMAKAKISQVKYLFQEHLCSIPHIFHGSIAVSLLITGVK